MESSPPVAEQRVGEQAATSHPSTPRSVIRGKDPQIEGQQLDEQQVLNAPAAFRYQPARKKKKSLSSSLGLGDGFAGGLTTAALLILLLITIGTPAALITEHLRKAGGPRGSPLPVVPEHPVKLVSSEEHVPVTPNLHQSFRALRHTSSRGILSAADSESWANVRKRFLAAIEQAEDSMDPKPLQGDELKELAFRKSMAMDLVCLENAAVEAQSAIEEAAGKSTNSPTDLGALYKAKMEARGRQARAAELWEAAVRNGLLGQDQGLQNSIIHLLMAVRSRAIASVYFTLGLMAELADHDGETIDGQYNEPQHVYQAVQALAVAGQIAANQQQIKAEVADWLSIIFSSV